MGSLTARLASTPPTHLCRVKGAVVHGDRKGQYGIRINDQWRVCFRWKDGDAYDVEIVDYH
ncbi:type II toxin-antitoxin system RelE/ParE family toxin [Chelativorans petroleitrophicus]|jgi:Plasmid maintenance system killer protein|uniref:type II toxin-antitoxin system RelE/ParE family toxin n=1 Tax=Chelativorans petroleitrophicus TaxID=2975484 RepID=UPI003C2AD8CD